MMYKSPTKPMKHQVEYLRRVRTRPGRPSTLDVFSINCDMGTGKSKMALDEWQQYVNNGELDALLVLAPAGSYTNWFKAKADDQPSELQRHLDPKLLKQVGIVAWRSGMGKQARAEFDRTLAKRSGPRAMFVNVEALSSVADAEKACVEFLRGSRCYLLVDESTVIKNKKAERTKVIVNKLGPLAKVRRIASGLMTPKSPMDLYWQYRFLDWRILGFETPIGFRDRYAVCERQCFAPNDLIRAKLLQAMGAAADGTPRLPGERLRGKLAAVRQHLQERTDTLATMDAPTLGRKLVEHAKTMRRDDMLALIEKLGGYIQTVVKIKEFQNLDELRQRLAPYTYRVLKEECLDLPPKVYEPYDVLLTDEQKRLYKEIKNNATAELSSGTHVTATTVVAQMLRLHQVVCGHTVDELGNLHDVKSNRVQAILDVQEEHDGKMIVWSTYQHEIRKIAAALREAHGPASVAVYYGGNRSTRDDDERRFLSEKQCRFMVSTQAAGGKGNTWVVSDLTVYAANNFDLEQRAQSEDRPHRKGQTCKVTYVDLIARGTIEEKIIKALRQKIDLTRAVTGDNWREWLV